MQHSLQKSRFSGSLVMATSDQFANEKEFKDCRTGDRHQPADKQDLLLLLECRGCRWQYIHVGPGQHEMRQKSQVEEGNQDQKIGDCKWPDGQPRIQFVANCPYKESKEQQSQKQRTCKDQGVYHDVRVMKVQFYSAEIIKLENESKNQLAESPLLLHSPQY